MQTENQVCFIIGAGEFNRSYCMPREGDFVIAADAGYLTLKKHGIIPNMIIGDMDSIEEAGVSFQNVIAPGYPIEVCKLPAEKDDTDMLAAIRKGLEKGYRNFAILGATGGRIDHTIANIQCLTFLSKQGCRACLYGRDSELQVVTNGSISFPAIQAGMIAVFSMGDAAKGVCLTGLKYPLENAIITNEFPIGVSNEFIGNPSSITVKEGSLLIIRYL